MMIARIPPTISALVFYRWGGLGLSALSVPLIFRLIPQNPTFGARLPQAFVSSDNWYAINAYTGKLLGAFGLVLFAISFPLANVLANVSKQWRALVIVLPVLVVLAMLRRVRRFATRFD